MKNGFFITSVSPAPASALSENAAQIAEFGTAKAEEVSAFHRTFPEYAPTPLHRLDALAKKLGVGEIFVKDESFRFGLNAFKVLGGSYAIGCCIAGRLGESLSAMSFDKLTSPETKERLGPLTFITATDGNHGRGVAWTAARLGQRSVVYMPKGTAKERLDNIRVLGSDASITDLCYDDAVRLAKKEAEEKKDKGYILVQDTSFERYEEIPQKIMQGYTTMALEALRQLGKSRPTHIFLQAGVGSMAGAVAAFFADAYGSARPKVIVVEPNGADCIYQTAEADDGELRFCKEELKSIMAGLCCGEPCPLAWKLLRVCADHFISMPDRAAEEGMRTLYRPFPGDPKIISGESGASTVGLLCCLMKEKELQKIRERIGLDADSKILCFSTEGATDRENFEKIVSRAE